MFIVAAGTALYPVKCCYMYKLAFTILLCTFPTVFGVDEGINSGDENDGKTTYSKTNQQPLVVGII